MPAFAGMTVWNGDGLVSVDGWCEGGSKEGVDGRFRGHDEGTPGGWCRGLWLCCDVARAIGGLAALTPPYLLGLVRAVGVVVRSGSGSPRRCAPRDDGLVG